MPQQDIKYLWIVGLEEGKVVQAGPYPDTPEGHDKASQIGMEKFPGNEWEIVKLSTYNDNEATRRIKHMKLESSSLMEALERFKHIKE